MSTKTDMTVQEFYSGFNLDFMSEEEKQTIYTATELFAKGKLRQQQCGMVWVRASERLPEAGKIKFARIDGHLLCMVQLSIQTGKIHFAGVSKPTEYDYDKTYWLDESPCPCDEYRKALEEILAIEDAAFGLPGFDVKRFKSKIAAALNK